METPLGCPLANAFLATFGIYAIMVLTEMLMIVVLFKSSDHSKRFQSYLNSCQTKQENIILRFQCYS